MSAIGYLQDRPTCVGIIACICCFMMHNSFSRPTEQSHHQLSFPESVASGVNTIYVPFSLVGQLMVVQARIDTQVGNFIVDTGAERLILNSHYFGDINAGREIAAIGNTGSVTLVKWQSVDSLHISQLYLLEIQAHLVDLHHIELKKNTRILGILGFNVFKKFEMMIDFQNRVIVLNRVDSYGIRLDSIPVWEIPIDSVNFTLKKHLIVVEANVNSVKLRLILDSGAELNLLHKRVNRKVLDRFTILKRINLVGVGKREVEVLAGILKDLQCGNQYCETMNTLLTNMDEINDTFGVSSHGVLGYEFLSSRRVMINYQKQKLYFFGPLRP